MWKLMTLAFFGVFIPMVALLVESSTGICKQMFFDPIPTALHIALVAVVPLGNLVLLVRTYPADYKPSFIDILIATVVLSICSVYALSFLPIL